MSNIDEGWTWHITTGSAINIIINNSSQISQFTLKIDGHGQLNKRTRSLSAERTSLKKSALYHEDNRQPENFYKQIYQAPTKQKKP